MASGKVCAFCDRSGHSKITREHAWPDWLGKGHKLIHSRKNYATGEKSEWLTAKGLVARGVCEECNTGWMSQLEDDAKPLLRPMMMGVVFWLSPEDQRVVRTWLIKTAMTMDLANPGDGAFFTQEERVCFWKTRFPHPEMRGSVWLSVYGGRHNGVRSFRFHREVDAVPRGFAGPARSFWTGMTTFQMNRLLAQLLWIRVDKDITDPFHMDTVQTKWQRRILHIGTPRRTIEWPGAMRPVADDELEEFVDRYRLFRGAADKPSTPLTDF
jgi:hypothetical protein